MKKRTNKSSLFLKTLIIICLIGIMSCSNLEALISYAFTSTDNNNINFDDLGITVGEPIQYEENESEDENYDGSESELETDNTDTSNELFNELNSYYPNFTTKYEDFKNLVEKSTTVNIKNELELRMLALYINKDAKDGAKEKIFNITNNIELSKNIEWTPIGNTSKKSFKGTLNGCGYTISGIKVTKKQSNVGIVGYNEGKITGIITKNFDISITPDVSSFINDLSSMFLCYYSNAGAIAGCNSGEIIGCTNNANINAATRVGGIVGYNIKNGKIINCKNSGNIKAYCNAGGIVGVQTGNDGGDEAGNPLDINNYYARIEECSNTGSVYATAENAGGIVGSSGKSSIVARSFNTGSISCYDNLLSIIVNGKTFTINPQNVGGIVGWCSGVTKKGISIVTDCYNEGGIYGYEDIGGLVGQLAGTGKGYAFLYNCANNTIDVTSSNQKAAREVGSIAGHVSVGNKDGISQAVVENCYYKTGSKEIEEICGSILQELIADIEMGSSSDLEEIIGNAGAALVTAILQADMQQKSMIAAGEIEITQNGDEISITKYDLKDTSYSQDVECVYNNKKYNIVQLRAYGLISDERKYNFDKENDNVVSNMDIDLNEQEFKFKNSIAITENNSSENYTLCDVANGTEVKKVRLTDSNMIEINEDKISIKNAEPILDSASISISYSRNANKEKAAIGDKLNVAISFNKDITDYMKEYDEENEKYINKNFKLYSKDNSEIKFNYINYSGNTMYFESDPLNEMNLTTLSRFKLTYNTARNQSESIVSDEIISNVLEVDCQKPKFIDYAVKTDTEGVLGCYKAGTKLTITVTTSEEVNEAPDLYIGFIDKDKNLTDLTEEERQAVANEITKVLKAEEIKNDNGKTIIKYIYEIVPEDYGKLVLNYKNAELVDMVGNKNVVSELIPCSDNNENRCIAGSILKYTTFNQNSEETRFFKAGDTVYIKATIDTKLLGYAENAVLKYIDGVKPELEIKLNDGTTLNPEYKDSEEGQQTNTFAFEYKVPENIEKYTLEMFMKAHGFLENENTGNKIEFTEENTKYTFTEKNKVILDSIAPTFNVKSEVENTNKNNTYKTGEKIIIVATSTEELRPDINTENAPKLSVKFGDEAGKNNEGKANCIQVLKDNNKITTIKYEYTISEEDNGILGFEFGDTSFITDIVGNQLVAPKNFITDNIVIKADNDNPTVQIIANNVNSNITNESKIEYTFKWSEEVKDFTADDVTVNNGIKEKMSDAVKNDDGTYSYKMAITSNVADGNIGNLQVIVEENVCQDLAGHSNVRSESIIKIDRKAPILLSLEAYVEQEIKLNKDIEAVKENYRIGEEITIVATFDENIVSLEENVTGLPELALQFSESGNAKGTVSGIPEGNKIIYTYEIKSEDEGTLSVKGFTGTVVDAAGNETRVTKRALDGDTIIADTTSPTLQALNVTSNKIENKATEEITIEAVYDEDVYALITKEDGTKEIVNITNENAPKLNISFGGVAAKGSSITAEYATKEDGTLDKTKIEYTYTVVGEEEAGDNGNLEINGLVNNENAQVCDIAGNTTNNTTNNVNTNGVLADTIRPQVTNITASIDESESLGFIENTKGDPLGETSYYKEKTVIEILVEYSEPIHEKLLDTIDIAFSENKLTTYKKASIINWNEDENTIRYKYTIENGDNGYLWVKVPEGIAKDEAGNLNFGADAEKLSNIYADTTAPTVTLLRDTTVEQDNQKITIKAQFSENVYDLNNNSRVTLTKTNAPKLIYSFGTGKNQEISASNIDGAIITYEINKNAVTDNGTLHYELAKGNLCDRAGNEYYQETTDTTAPILEEVVISSNAGMYDPYCKAGTEIYVTATFDEAIAAKNIKLKATIGNVETAEINGESVAENPKQIKFTYTVKAGDNGEFEIKDICGEVDSNITEENADNTYGWVRDEKGNQNNIYNLKDEGITPTGEAEADTKAPTLTITSDVERTNKEVVTYTFTWSETVTGFTASDIEVTNGLKGEFTVVPNTDGKVYTLKVDVLEEGRQIVKVNAGVCEDVAGNENLERVTYNKVVIDYTKPVVRAKVNGGNYVLDNTDPENKKSTLKETIVVDEELSSMQYVWSSSETIPEAGWVSEDVSTILVNSDINLTKEVKETGTYYLYIKATDIAGNILSTRTKAFVVKTSQIKLIPDKTEITNKDVTVTVEYGEGLTENRKAGVSGLTQSADASIVIITENGIVYAEATDKAGNKVCNSIEITNINKTEPEKPPVEEDKTAPTITFNYTTTTATVGTPIGATISTDEDAIISYSWDNKTWTTSQDYVRTQSVNKTPSAAGTYTLYAKAVDKSSNQSTVQKLEFTVVNSEEDIKRPEVIFEDLPTMQVNGVKYVKISAGMTIDNLASKMDKNALCDATPKYTKLTSDNKLRTSSEITINGETKYVIIVNGDVNGDGKVTFIEDVIMANNYRIGQIKLSTVQMLAADVNNSGEIEFIPDIVAINNFRLGIIKSL